MTEKYVANTKLGLWGPSFCPTNLLSNKLDNMPQKKSVASDVFDEGVSTSLTAGILSAVRLSNTNLIQLHNRMAKSTRKDSNRIILQTEALSLFKGNFIRILKTLFTPEMINRIKRWMSIGICLDEVDPVIDRVWFAWDDNRDYIPSWEQACQKKLKEAFANISLGDYEQEAIIALRDNPIHGVSSVPVDLKRVLVYEDKKPLQISDINFDSITSIKF